MPHKQYFAGTLMGMSSCSSYVSRTHDVIDDVTRSQSRSNFEIDISPSIFELERRSKAQNAHSYISGIFNFRYIYKVCRELKIAVILKILKYYTQLQFDLRYEKIVPNYAKKSISWWWRHRWRHRVALMSALYIFFTNEITTFFMITKKTNRYHHLTSCAYVSWDYDYNYINIYSWHHWWRHQVTK